MFCTLRTSSTPHSRAFSFNHCPQLMSFSHLFRLRHFSSCSHACCRARKPSHPVSSYFCALLLVSQHDPLVLAMPQLACILQSPTACARHATLSEITTQPIHSVICFCWHHQHLGSLCSKQLYLTMHKFTLSYHVSAQPPLAALTFTPCQLFFPPPSPCSLRRTAGVFASLILPSCF